MNIEVLRGPVFPTGKEAFDVKIINDIPGILRFSDGSQVTLVDGSGRMTDDAAKFVLRRAFPQPDESDEREIVSYTGPRLVVV